MKKINYFFGIVIIAFTLLLPFGRVSLAASDDGIYTYVFHLTFDGTSLAGDPSFAVPYDLIADDYNNVKLSKQPGSNLAVRGEVSLGKIYAIDNSLLTSFSFSLQAGKNNVYAPYFANAGKAELFASNQSQPLVVSLSGSSVCNEDKICNSAAGETNLNCPTDCQAGVIIATSTSPATNSTDIIIFAAIGLLAIGIMAAGIIYLRKNKKAG